MISTKRHVTVGLLAGLASIGVAAPSWAQSAADTNPPVVLNTSLTVGYRAPNEEMPTKRRDGAGVMDTTISFDRATGEIFSFFTRSVPWGGNTGLNTGMQAGLATATLTANELSAPVEEKDLPPLRTKGTMRSASSCARTPSSGRDFVAVVFADSELNGRNQQSNPQSVVSVYDRKTLAQTEHARTPARSGRRRPTRST